ncbi:hypothetical protein [Syntrophomonas palmitatica]|uniref:hypothetical protein n=1 Tax=Syntrophomonas palmitatica TaxID=402877 RepID=UPI0006D14140|nr:hypothetical protein [Syntrophomonas palmitatica]
MPEEKNKETTGGKEQSDTKQDNIMMPDFIELWKEMYFKTEESWTNTTKELITTRNFIAMLDQIRDQYLSYHKVSEQNLDKYFKLNPVPSKRDLARVAELVIGLEDKIDQLDLQFASNINRITTSLIKLVDYQTALKDEIAALRQENTAISQKLDNLLRAVQGLHEPAASYESRVEINTAPKRKSRKKNETDESK